jgi:fibronectin type 3 domain-containing protein
VTFTAADVFPPAVPSGVTALAAADSINVAWHRNTEPDLKGYCVYRSTNNGPFERQGDLIGVPTYTDRKVEHGKTYAYRVTAVDKRGNESEPSSSVDTQF